MTETAEVKTEKVFDINSGKHIENPIEEKKVDNSNGRSKEGAENIKEREESTKGEKKEDNKEDKKEEKAQGVVFDTTKYLKEKFGVDSEDALTALLEGNKALAKELEEAKKPKEYEFKSEKEKSIATFLNDWDMDNVGEGIEMAGRLMKMDPEKMNEKTILQEQFVIENSDISREKAIKLFNDEYKKSYVLDKESFEKEEDYKEAQELADIKKEKKVVAAKKLLLDKKETLKYKEKEKPKEEEKRQEVPQIPKENIDKYVGEVNKFFSPSQGEDFDRFIYQLDDDEDIKVAVQFSKEELDNIKKETTAYLHSPVPYDKDKKIDKFDSGKLVAQIADILYGDQIKERMLKEVKKLAQTLRIEQLADHKPDKKSGGGGKGKEGIPSIEEQFVELGKKAVIDRGKKK